MTPSTELLGGGSHCKVKLLPFSSLNKPVGGSVATTRNSITNNLNYHLIPFSYSVINKLVENGPISLVIAAKDIE